MATPKRVADYRPATRRLALVRLMQLASPAWPVGGFSYSQGLEWAYENGWLDDRDSVTDWLDGIAQEGLAQVDIPLLARMYSAFLDHDPGRAEYWSQRMIAARETAELRNEEHHRALAMATLLRDTGVLEHPGWFDGINGCYAAGFACACTRWDIPVEDAALGYAWSWVENQVAAAIRLLPRLGHTGGVQIQMALGDRLPAVVETGLTLRDDQIGSNMPALAIASSRHESQQTRLFRS